MQTTPIEKSFCTTREAAALLGVSVGTVQLWAESGLLRAWKTAGGHRRVMRDSVNDLLHNKTGPKPAGEKPESAVSAPRRLKILVVEDDANLLRLYEATISCWTMVPTLMVASNAVAALLLIGRSNPDLLVTDLHMPGMDGFNMLRVLRETPETRNTTIVVVSGLDAANIHDQGGIPPNIEVLPKPVPFNRLEAIAIEIAIKNGFQTKIGG
jgi:excisionase family DNA binding protein